MAETSTRKPRGNTRKRIQEVTFDLFVKQGYEKTSLREVSEVLEISKPAIYYHFKTKEEILNSIFKEVSRPVEEIIAWGKEQPATLETKHELLRRYSLALDAAIPLYRFMRENEATVRDLQVGTEFSQQMSSIGELLTGPDVAMHDQLRCMSALLTLHFGTFTLDHFEGEREEKRLALLDICRELVDTAHRAEAA